MTCNDMMVKGGNGKGKFEHHENWVLFSRRCCSTDLYFNSYVPAFPIHDGGYSVKVRFNKNGNHWRLCLELFFCFVLMNQLDRILSTPSLHCDEGLTSETSVSDTPNFYAVFKFPNKFPFLVFTPTQCY